MGLDPHKQRRDEALVMVVDESDKKKKFTTARGKRLC